MTTASLRWCLGLFILSITTGYADNCTITQCHWLHLSSDSNQGNPVTRKHIEAYSATIAIRLNSYRFNQFFETAAALAFQFTEDSWSDFLEAQSQSGNVEWIQTEQVNAKARLRGDVISQVSFEEPSMESWVVAVPLTISYDAKSRVIDQPVLAQITWKPAANNESVYLINGYRMLLDGAPKYAEKKQQLAHCKVNT